MNNITCILSIQNETRNLIDKYISIAVIYKLNIYSVFICTWNLYITAFLIHHSHLISKYSEFNISSRNGFVTSKCIARYVIVHADC